MCMFPVQMFAGIGIFGTGNSSSLLSALIVNAVQMVATMFAVVLVSLFAHMCHHVRSRAGKLICSYVSPYV